MDHGTDRDVALMLLEKVTDIAQLVTDINDNLYVPHIITQPVSVEADLGDTIAYTVVANNVKSYQWQYNATGTPTNWRDSSYTGNQTNTLTYELTQARVNYLFRCIITGNDNSQLISNTVQVTQAPIG